MATSSLPYRLEVLVVLESVTVEAAFVEVGVFCLSALMIVRLRSFVVNAGIGCDAGVSEVAVDLRRNPGSLRTT